MGREYLENDKQTRMVLEVLSEKMDSESKNNGLGLIKKKNYNHLV